MIRVKMPISIDNKPKFVIRRMESRTEIIWMIGYPGDWKKPFNPLRLNVITSNPDNM